MYGVGRKTYHYPQTWKSDMRVGRIIQLKFERKLEVLAESFNLFNHQNLREIETVGYTIEPGGAAGGMPTFNFLTGLKPGQTEFGQPLNVNATDFYRERQFDFGLRLRFWPGSATRQSQISSKKIEHPRFFRYTGASLGGEMHSLLNRFTRLHMRSTRTALVICLALLCGATAFSDPIHDAARKGNVKKIKEILASDPKAINARDNLGDTPLHTACLHNQLSAVEVLVAAGADVNAKNSYPPFMPDDLGQFLSSTNQEDPITLLHSQAAKRSDELNTQQVTAQDVKEKGYTPLQLAEFASGHNKIIQYLVAHGADVNAQGATGATALFFAVLRDQGDDVKFLLAHGANPNITEAYGDTPLVCALQLGYVSLVKPLVEKGADVNIQNQSLMRALGYAMQNPKDESIVDYLKKKGAHQ